jgi:predicted hotdog family 3-hydroxylacyl-ACP dehydratase
MAENILEEPIITREMILQLIPQRPPFVMVDSLIEYTNLTGITGFLIPPDNILVKDGLFSEPGIIEHMAQSMSLHRGYHGFLAGLEKPKTGFIGAIKSVEIFELPKAGKLLKTYVEILHEVMNVTSVTARTIDEAGTTLAVSEMKTVTVD